MTYQSINPFSEERIKTFPDHSDEMLDRILARAKKTYADDWSRRPYSDRARVIGKAATLLRENHDSFATIAVLEMGKLLREAQDEVSLCANILEYYARNAQSFLAPRVVAVDRGEAMIETSPLGVIFCVEPWNFPYYQLARVAAPNLMAGNVLVVKHAPNVPQCALAFEKLFLDAGAPEGVYSNVFLSNEQAATAIADSRVVGVALTGSERAGAAVGSEAGKALKKSTMELGGSDAFVVLADADMELAVRLGVMGRIRNSGQQCSGAKRFIVHESIADEFQERFIAELKKLVPGDGMDPTTTLAPLCSETALNGALKQIEVAMANGAEVAYGGSRLKRKGYFLEPTILANVDKTNPAYSQEFFSPVAMFFRVSSDEAAIAVANDSPYGLGGTVITADKERGKRVARGIDTGMVYINMPAVSSPELPFGGVKHSGFGGELSDLGIAEFVNRKLIRIA